jgi:hypothetical protein
MLVTSLWLAVYPRKLLTGMDRIKTNDECGMMNDELKTTAFHSSFIIPHSSFLSYPVHPVHPC